jgi:hypothetical protein
MEGKQSRDDDDNKKDKKKGRFPFKLGNFLQKRPSPEELKQKNILKGSHSLPLLLPFFFFSLIFGNLGGDDNAITQIHLLLLRCNKLPHL